MPSKLKLSAVKVLLHGENRHLVDIEKAALQAFEFRNIEWSPTMAALREALSYDFNDIILVNDCPGQDLKKVIRMLRNGEDSNNPYAVVVVVTPTPSRKFIKSAVSFGADGVIGLPFSPASLWKQLAFFINNQRTFLRAKDYFGPDRRRLNLPNYQGAERRDSNDAVDQFTESLRARNS